MNIFQIQQNLIELFDSIEEAGGEITPEQEQELAINKNNLSEKIKDYSNVIKSLEADINTIKEEQKRLKDLAERKSKVIDRLKVIMLDAIKSFGDEKKSGVKYIDYGTGEVSIRKSNAVELNDLYINGFIDNISTTFSFLKQNNQLDTLDKLDVKEVTDTFLNAGFGTDISENDIDHIKVNLSFNMNAKDLFDANGYKAFKEIVKYTDFYDVKSAISKSDIKRDLQENGSCAPNIAKLVTNENVQIK